MECGREQSPLRFREQNKNDVLGSRPKPTPYWVGVGGSPRSRDLLVPLSRVRSVSSCVDFCANNLLRPSVVRCARMDRRHPHRDIVVDEFMTRRPSFPWPVSASGRPVLGGGGTISNSRCPFAFPTDTVALLFVVGYVVLFFYAGVGTPILPTIPDSSNRPQRTGRLRQFHSPFKPRDAAAGTWSYVSVPRTFYCISLSVGIPLLDS